VPLRAARPGCPSRAWLAIRVVPSSARPRPGRRLVPAGGTERNGIVWHRPSAVGVRACCRCSRADTSRVGLRRQLLRGIQRHRHARALGPPQRAGWAAPDNSKRRVESTTAGTWTAPRGARGVRDAGRWIAHMRIFVQDQLSAVVSSRQAHECTMEGTSTTRYFSSPTETPAASVSGTPALDAKSAHVGNSTAPSGIWEKGKRFLHLPPLFLQFDSWFGSRVLIVIRFLQSTSCIYNYPLAFCNLPFDLDRDYYSRSDFCILTPIFCRLAPALDLLCSLSLASGRRRRRLARSSCCFRIRVFSLFTPLPPPPVRRCLARSSNSSSGRSGTGLASGLAGTSRKVTAVAEEGCCMEQVKWP
jgi:hypothetical protein